MNLIPVRKLKAWAWNAPMKQIYDGDLLYLERFYLGAWRGWTAFVHRFVVSDPDRGVHDHPYDGFSILLNGTYTEEILPRYVQDTIDLMRPLFDRQVIGMVPGHAFRKVRLFNRIPAEKFHRVLLNGDEVWSLFVHRRQWKKSWGFLREGQYHVYDDTDEGPREGWRGEDAITPRLSYLQGEGREQWGPLTMEQEVT